MTEKVNKNKTCLIRLSETDNAVFDLKAAVLGTNKSGLLRDAAFHYWNGTSSDKSAGKLLSLYQDSDDDQKRIVVEMIFQFLRQHGYPHNKLTRDELIRGMLRISNTKNPLLEDDHLQTNTTGLDVANSFHSHMVKVQCLTGFKTAYELFSDDDGLRDAINRWMELGEKPTMGGIRRILRTRNKVRSVVNFKPAISKFFYDNYCPKDGSILDPCAGYGGRLAGCIGSNRGLHYHGIDPDGDTSVGNMKMASFFREVRDIERCFDFEFKFDLGCAEDVMPGLSDESYDLIFTSPPYFDIEKYSSNPDQSYKKFNTYERWCQGFLFQIVKQSARVVRADGYVIFNVKNYDKMKMADDLLAFAERVGLKLKKTYNMRLANSEFNRRKDEPTFHTEPIFVLTKQG